MTALYCKSIHHHSSTPKPNPILVAAHLNPQFSCAVLCPLDAACASHRQPCAASPLLKIKLRAYLGATKLTTPFVFASIPSHRS